MPRGGQILSSAVVLIIGSGMKHAPNVPMLWDRSRLKPVVAGPNRGHNPPAQILEISQPMKRGSGQQRH
jgi:hypothetical protein